MTSDWELKFLHQRFGDIKNLPIRMVVRIKGNNIWKVRGEVPGV